MSAGQYDPDQSAVDTRRIQPWNEAFRVGTTRPEIQNLVFCTSLPILMLSCNEYCLLLAAYLEVVLTGIRPSEMLDYVFR